MSSSRRLSLTEPAPTRKLELEPEPRADDDESDANLTDSDHEPVLLWTTWLFEMGEIVNDHLETYGSAAHQHRREVREAAKSLMKALARCGKGAPEPYGAALRETGRALKTLTIGMPAESWIPTLLRCQKLLLGQAKWAVDTYHVV